jgi:hypothetical protein
MKRPVVVWIFCIAIMIGIIWDIISSLTQLIVPSVIQIIMSALILILAIPRIIMVVNFFKLKSKAKLWAHISFGSLLGLAVINYIIFFITLKPTMSALVVPPSILYLAFYAFIWWAVVDYIKKKQIDGKPLFS